MRSILRATGILGGSSMVTIAVGLVSAKAAAVLIGPSGLGLMSLLQGLLSMSVLIAGFGVGAGVVRAGAHAIQQGDQERLAAMFQGAWLVTLALGGVGLAALIVLRIPVSQAVLGSSSHAGFVIVVGVALVFSVASGLQGSILNAHHRIGALARAGILSSVLGTAASVALIWRWRQAGIGPAVLSVAVVGFCVTSYLVRREIPRMRVMAPRHAILDQTRSLLRFGGPYTASMLVGTGVQMALPLLVLHALGTASVGYYKAATAVASTYLGFMLIAMAQDYFPRVSAVSDRPAELRDIVNQQHLLVMLLGIPVILGTLALVPYLIPLVYSPSFSPAAKVLQWQLAGDIFKFSAWTMSFVILARCGGRTYFVAELIGGAAIFAASWGCLHAFGLPGLGMGYLVGYIVYYLVVTVIVRREIGLVWTRQNALWFSSGVVAVGVVLGASVGGLSDLSLPVSIGLASVAALNCLGAIYLEAGGFRRARTA